MKMEMCACKKHEKREGDRMCDWCWDEYCDKRDEFRQEMNDQLAERRGYPRNNEEDP